MKVCKKCKTKVANKAKICKKCGADVSKAKIIKTTTNNTSKKSNSQIKTTNSKKTSAVSKSKKKAQVVKQEPKKEIVRHKHNNKEKAIYTGESIKKIVKYFSVEIFESLKNSIVITCVSVIAIIKSLFKSSKVLAIKTKKTHIKQKEKRVERRIEKQKKKELERQQIIELEEPEEQQIELEEYEVKPKSKKKRLLKVGFALVFIGLLCCAGYYIHGYVYQELNGTSRKVVVGEKATTDKIFSMNDVITYNDVDYRIVKIETSKGNNYKSPKEGHQFLIVTIYIKNNSNKKAPYSYENWTMSNSKGEEKKRIFTSINVDTALYSGELVVGGIKTGSMVFEQPINDKKLQMNYYELKKDKDGNEVIDQSKRIFSVSVKSPTKVKKVSDNSQNSNTKVIKNS